jgi:hypothetical protein
VSTGSLLGCGEGALEAVEDEVEAEQELVAVVVAGLEDVAHGDLGEVRVRVAEGRSISAKTTSMMPSRRSCLLATWWYSDMATTPSSWASLRMLSDPMPPRSARATDRRRKMGASNATTSGRVAAAAVDQGPETAETGERT